MDIVTDPARYPPGRDLFCFPCTALSPLGPAQRDSLPWAFLFLKAGGGSKDLSNFDTIWPRYAPVLFFSLLYALSKGRPNRFKKREKVKVKS